MSSSSPSLTTTRHPLAISSRRVWSSFFAARGSARRRGRSIITCRIFPKETPRGKKTTQKETFGFDGGSRARARKSAEMTRKTGKRTKTNVVSSEAKKRRANNGRNVARRNGEERRWTSKYQERITTKKRDTKRKEKNSIFTTRTQTREKSETITNKKSERTKDNQYNRQRDRSKSFDLSARVTQFYPSSQSFQPFGEDPGKNAEDSERW